MKTAKGDLVEMTVRGEFDVMVHGCNCFHTMGAGIAKAISTQFPEALEAKPPNTAANPNLATSPLPLSKEEPEDLSS